MVTATLSRQTVVSLQAGGSLIFHPKARTVFRLTLASVIEPRRRYVSMPKPLLNLCDIGIVRKVWCRSLRSPQRAGAASLRARSNERNAARYDQARKSSSATTRIVSGNPDGARKRWMATMFTMTGASRVNASGTKRPVRSAAPVIVYVPKSSGKKYPLATSPAMNSGAAPFIVGSGNQCKNPFRPKTKKTRPRRTRVTMTALDLMVKKMLPAAADHLLHAAAVSHTKSSYRLGAWPISEVSVATSALLGAKPRSSYPWNISRSH